MEKFVIKKSNIKKNIFYAQSGGVTPVINATARGIYDAYLRNKKIFGKLYVGRNGIAGALNEDLIDIETEKKSEIMKLIHTPGGAFGSCRIKLKDPRKNQSEFKKIFNVFQAHNIGYFLYNGGGDSQDTTLKLSKFFRENKLDIKCIGIPKTIDNDLPETYSSPGFGTVAKYIATSTLEASLDVSSMSNSSTKVFLLEVMGRHAGWLAASSGVIKGLNNNAPHIILFPEIAFDKSKFLKKVKKSVDDDGFCVIVSSEGIKDKKGDFISSTKTKDSFGHSHLGGVAPLLARMITGSLNIKVHWAVADYLQRASRHIGSKADVEQAYIVGEESIKLLKKNISDVMVTIKRSVTGKKWRVGSVKLEKVANTEKKLPKNFITKDGFSITRKCKEYINEMILGEDIPPFKKGLPDYAKLQLKLTKKILK